MAHFIQLRFVDTVHVDTKRKNPPRIVLLDELCRADDISVGRSGFFQNPPNDTPDCEIIFRGYFDGLVIRICRDQQNPVRQNFHPFQRKFAVYIGHGQTTIIGFHGFVHDQNIPFDNPFVLHGISFDAGEKCSFGVTYNQAVQIKRTFEKIVRRRRKASMNGTLDERYFNPRFILRFTNFQLYHTFEQ